MKNTPSDKTGDFNASVIMLALLPFILILEGTKHFYFWIGIIVGAALHHFFIA